VTIATAQPPKHRPRTHPPHHLSRRRRRTHPDRHICPRGLPPPPPPPPPRHQPRRRVPAAVTRAGLATARPARPPSLPRRMHPPSRSIRQRGRRDLGNGEHISHRAVRLLASERRRGCVQFTGDWKVCPQTWQAREPTPAFLSILTVTERSWLQKRQEKMMGSEEPFFFGGGLVAFLRLPWIEVVRMEPVSRTGGVHHFY
jgi:hypothetical protein